LLPQANLQGNRRSRLNERTEELLTTFSGRFLPDGDGNHRPGEHLFALFEAQIEMMKVAVRISCANVSLQEVGQRLGYQPTTLYKINQTACHAIAERFTAYRRKLREKRLQGYREEIRQIALLLQAEKVALTRKHIARYLAQPAILRDPKVRAILREVYREVELHSRDTLG
jgi:hypothetical protein